MWTDIATLKNWHFLRSLKHRVTLCPSQSTPRCSPKRTGNARPHRNVLNVCRSIIHKSQKVETAQMPIGDEWRNKVWYFHTMEYFWASKRNEVLIHATWVNLKNILPSEKPVTWDHTVYVSIYVKCSESGNPCSQMGGCLKLRGNGVTAHGDEISFGGDETVPKLVVVIAAQLCEYTTTQWNGWMYSMWIIY